MASCKVVGNKGCAGVDGMDTKRWREKEELHLRELRQRLMNDTYRSKPVMRKHIPKPGSKKQRPLGIPAVSDRVFQQAVCNPLSPVFEEYFHEDSYGFRPGRSTHAAAKRVEALRKQGFGPVVYLTVLDNALTEEGCKFVRYADDVLILCQNEKKASGALNYARGVLGRLKLELNEEKTRIS
jgi:retron-type reverse transcriptase